MVFKCKKSELFTMIMIRCIFCFSLVVSMFLVGPVYALTVDVSDCAGVGIVERPTSRLPGEGLECEYEEVCERSDGETSVQVAGSKKVFALGSVDCKNCLPNSDPECECEEDPPPQRDCGQRFSTDFGIDSSLAVHVNAISPLFVIKNALNTGWANQIYASGTFWVDCDCIVTPCNRKLCEGTIEGKTGRKLVIPHTWTYSVTVDPNFCIPDADYENTATGESSIVGRIILGAGICESPVPLGCD